MSKISRKFKPFLYPAAFVLIAGFAFAYKIVLKGNAGYVVRTVRGGNETVIASESAPETSKNEISATTSSSTAESVMASTVQVYICGAVRNPGVYSVIAGTILNDAVEKAGGFTDDAAVTSMNLVYVINSNMSFYIPTVKEAESGQGGATDVIRGKGTFIWGGDGSTAQDKTNAKVNINTADQAIFVIFFIYIASFFYNVESITYCVKSVNFYLKKNATNESLRFSFYSLRLC